MSKRSEVQEFILTNIEALLPGGGNREIYEKLFSSMNDIAFHQWMLDLKADKYYLTIIAPSYMAKRLSLENNLALGTKLKHEFFQRLWIEGTNGMPTYLTPNKYLVVDLPLRRTAQRLVKKVSVSPHSRVVDTLTGQPAGDSKAASTSYPEVQLCAALGLDNTMVEVMKYRGGDSKGVSAFNNMLAKYGVANIKTLSTFTSGVESTKTLNTLLTCMHVKSNL